MSWMQFGPIPYEIGSTEAPGVTPEHVAHALSQINRFTGHSIWPYSVARHSVLVANLLENDGCAPGVVLWGLVHDVAETVVNDVSQPVKAAMSDAWREEWKRIEHAAEQALFKVLGVAWPMPTPVAAIVKRADWVAVATERRDLMLPCERIWDMVPYPPADVVVEPTDRPYDDALSWLSYYHRLT